MKKLTQTQNKKRSDVKDVEQGPADVVSTSFDEAAIFGDFMVEEPSTTTNGKQKNKGRSPAKRKRRNTKLTAVGKAVTSNQRGIRTKPTQAKPILTPSAMKALGTSVATVKPRKAKKRAATTGPAPMRQAVPNPSIVEKEPTKHNEFQLVLGQKGGKQLNEEHVQLFFETVGDAVLDLTSCSTFIPTFESCKIRNGKIMVTAKNRASRDWLLRHLGKIRPNGAELVVAGPAEIPSSITYKTGFIWVPTARYEDAEIMQILESQNPELMVSSWKVLGRQPESWGLTLKVNIDSRCISALEDIDFKPYFVLRRVDVKLLQDLKRKITSDPNTGTDIIGPPPNKRQKKQSPAASVGENANKVASTSTAPVTKSLPRRSRKPVRRKIEAPKSNSAKGIPQRRMQSPPRSGRQIPLKRKPGSPRRREMLSRNRNQKASRIPSLLDMNTTIPNVSQMRAPSFHNSTMDKELTFDDGGNAVWNNSIITSRELDDSLNMSIYAAERDNLAYDRNESFSSRVTDSARNSAFSDRVRDSLMFQESRERDLIPVDSLFSRRAESYIGRKFLIENSPVTQRSTFSPPKDSYEERDTFSSHPGSRLEPSSLISYPNPTNYSRSGLSFMSSVTRFPPRIESRVGSGSQQQFTSMRSREEPNSSRNVSGFSRSLNEFYAPQTSLSAAMRQLNQRSKKFK